MDKQKVMGNSLDMDELEQVSGGSIDECVNDLQLFEKRIGRKLYTDTYRYAFGIPFPKVDEGSLARLKKAFAEFGVTVDIALGSGKVGEDVHNDYYLNGKLTSRKAVWDHICLKMTGRPVDG